MAKRTLEVLLDCDQVLADFVQAVLNVAEEITGKRVFRSEIVEWEVFSLLGRMFPNHEGLEEKLRKASHTPGFCASLPECPGAREGFEKVSRRNIKVYIVTSPLSENPTWHGEREAWLRDHFGISDHNVVHTHAKYTVHGDLFVDDKPAHVTKWGERGRHTASFLWDTPHNQESKLPRLYGWDDLDALLEARGL